MSASPKQIEARDAYYKNNCSEKTTAEDLGISIGTLRDRLYRCAKHGLRIDPDTFSPEAPAGFGTFMSTIHVKDGEVVQRWDRVKPFETNFEQLFEYLGTRIPVGTIKSKKPKKVDSNIQLEWTLADYHFGLLAWGKETGVPYDMKIARQLLTDTASDIFQRAGKVKETVLVLMGDNFHTDFFSNQTEASKHTLSVDSRYPKVIQQGVDTFISAIEMCLQYSEKVKVIVLYGNHDQQTSVVLPFILSAHFRNESRVEVDLSPAKKHYNYWGCNATAYHHGDKVKKDRLCGEFTRDVAMSGKKGIQYFYVKQGHLHSELIEDINGVTFEIVPSPVAKDDYATASSFTAKRATVATAYHKQYGQVFRYEVTPQALQLKGKL